MLLPILMQFCRFHWWLKVYCMLLWICGCEFSFMEKQEADYGSQIKRGAIIQSYDTNKCIVNLGKKYTWEAWYSCSMEMRCDNKTTTHIANDLMFHERTNLYFFGRFSQILVCLLRSYPSISMKCSTVKFVGWKKLKSYVQMGSYCPPIFWQLK